MIHYPQYIADFNNATRHLTFVERALYRELLDLYYDTEKPLPCDVARLARRVLANTDELRDALQIVLEEFFERREDGWHNERCDQEIAAYQAKQEQQSRAGRASASKRGKKKAAPEPFNERSSGAINEGGSPMGGGSTDVQRPFNARSTNQNQNQNHKEKKTSSSKSSDDGGGDAQRVASPRPDADVPTTQADWSVLFGEEFGVEVGAADIHARRKFWPLASSWVQAGVSVGQMRAAVARARSEATEAIAYLPAYVDRVLATIGSGAASETRSEAAARARMQEVAPLAASRGASPHEPAAVDGYAFFERALASVPSLEMSP
ncbi:YdaU family protein [Paracidovorax wautersii]|uniref:YdaU family protein n=1 Tax=Paracidovorax wautersii TaxID=1177982 RepID=UPI0031D6C25D